MRFIENPAIITVVLSHPDDTSITRTVAVQELEYPWTDEEYEAWKADVIYNLTKQFNSAGYWHEVEFYQQVVVDGKAHEVEL